MIKKQMRFNRNGAFIYLTIDEMIKNGLPEDISLDNDYCGTELGISDKNNSPLYSGDILGCVRNDGTMDIYHITEHNCGFVMNMFPNETENNTKLFYHEAIADAQNESFVTHACELIGNIYKI